MDLLVVLPIDLVMQIEPDEVLTDRYLVTGVDPLVTGDAVAVEKGSVARIEVRDIVSIAAAGFAHGADHRVLAGHLGIVYSNVRLEGAAQCNLLAFKRDRDSQELAAQKDECGP